MPTARPVERWKAGKTRWVGGCTEWVVNCRPFDKRLSQHESQEHQQLAAGKSIWR